MGIDGWLRGGLLRMLSCDFYFGGIFGVKLYLRIGMSGPIFVGGIGGVLILDRLLGIVTVCDA
jgi:hypothetical protein